MDATSDAVEDLRTFIEQLTNNVPAVEELRSLIEQWTNNVPGGQLTLAQIETALGDLQRVDETNIVELGDSDSLCPICLTPYHVILLEEELALAMNSPAHPIEELGISKLAQSWQCGHLFCRRDITKWITSGHDSCPLCRRQLLQEQRSSESRIAELEVFSQALVHVREQLREQLRELRDVGRIGILEAHNVEHVEDDRDEPSLNSGMYS